MADNREPFNFAKLDRPGRPSNRELCDAFRKLLTEGFYTVNKNGDRNFQNYTDMRLEETKPWRGELWKAFAEIEERLDPLGVETRRRLKHTEGKTDGN